MKMNKLLTMLVCIAFMLSAAAIAAETDPGRKVRLTVVLQDGDAALPGVSVSIYRIASVNGDGKYAILPPFDQYNIELDIGSESALAGIASTLEGYVLRDKIDPAYVGETGQDGRVIFPTEGNTLEQGMYLLMGQEFTREGKVYTIQPSMVQLPLWNSVDGQWIYDVEVNAKFEVRPDDPEPEPVKCKVLKIWRDEGYESARPAEIAVQLLRDGEVFETVALNAETLWRYTWENLDPDYRWSVVEKETDGYSVVITREGITFVVTNTYKPEEPDETEKPGEPTPTPKPTTPPDDEEDEKPKDEKLPQTGQPWWPVAMLVCAGLLLVVIGLIRRRGD